jgi:hypothetical protein
VSDCPANILLKKLDTAGEKTVEEMDAALWPLIISECLAIVVHDEIIPNLGVEHVLNVLNGPQLGVRYQCSAVYIPVAIAFVSTALYSPLFLIRTCRFHPTMLQQNQVLARNVQKSRELPGLNAIA